MNHKLPKIGRPSKSGLSVKELGTTEYQRQIQEMRRRRLGKARRFFTGLSLKILSRADYSAAYRFLNNQTPRND